jgi:hypothetical protein
VSALPNSLQANDREFLNGFPFIFLPLSFFISSPSDPFLCFYHTFGKTVSEEVST